MNLPATPFEAQPGELLPLYRDAYLRGDLARLSAQAVENYLRRDAGETPSLETHWHQLPAAEISAAAPGWAGKQLQRFRHRALSLGLVGMMLAGASVTANRLPAGSLPAVKLPAATLSRTVVLHGRILNEQGQPMAGATVRHKGTSRATSTDANGNYSLPVPADERVILQYGHGGHTDQEVQATSGAATVASVVFQP